MEPTKSLDSLSKLFADCAELERAAILLADISGRGPEALERCEKARQLVDEARRVLDPGTTLAFEDRLPDPEPRPKAITALVGRIAKKFERAHPENGLTPLLPPSKNHVLAMQGSSRNIPLSQLLSFLGSLQETGVVKVKSDFETFTLELQHGVVVHAQSDNAPRNALLGNILVEMGSIDRDRLEQALLSSHGARVGETLEKGELVDREQLRKAIERQIQMLFDRMFQAQEAVFSFWKGDLKHTDGRVHLNVMQLLLESARSADERRRAAQAAAT